MLDMVVLYVVAAWLIVQVPAVVPPIYSYDSI